MAKQIQTLDAQGSCEDILRTIDLIGLNDSIESPGNYTCYSRLDLFNVEVGVLPGHFTAREIAELYKAAGVTKEEAIQHALDVMDQAA